MNFRSAAPIIVSFALTACSIELFAPPATLTPTVTLSPTITSTPTLTPTATPTFTPTPFPTPVGITFNFDDGVSLGQQGAIRQGIALAQQYFGESGATSVYAFSSLDKLTEEYASRNRIFVNNPAAISFRKDFEERGVIGKATLGIIYFYIADYWGRAPLASRLETVAHEYFHTVQRNSSNLLEGEGAYWLIEGSADWAAYRAVSTYGFVDLDYVRRRTIDRTRGLLSPLSSMETLDGADQEDDLGKYTLGYLASEYLASLVGEEALLHRYWSGLRFSPGWRAGFQATFGMSLKEFYAKFEEYRRAQFPPYCGKVGDPLPKDAPILTIDLYQQSAPGSYAIVSDSSYVPYVFCMKGYRLASLTSSQMNLAFKLPSRNSSVNLCGGNCIIVSMSPSMSAGPYRFSIELPDGRKAEAKFDHTVPSGTATLTLTPKP